MSDKLTLRQLNRATLARQGLLKRHTGTVADVVGRLAGLQAQHANSPYVALWTRRDGQTINELESALTDRSVVKATLMRATLHLIDARDFWAYDVATAGPRLANWNPSAKRAGVDLEEVNAAVLEFCSQPRSVADIETHLEERYPGKLSGEHAPSGVRNIGFRMASAAGGLVHVPPSGMWKSHGKPEYVDARLWLGNESRPDVEEALERIVELYVRAHGPVTSADIMKWAGQRRITAVRAALEALADRLVRLTGPDGVEMVDLVDGGVLDDDASAPARYLSRWDSILIAYDDRDRILPPQYKEAVIKKNGDFLQTFLVDGFVAGLWNIVADGDSATLRLEPFDVVPPVARAELEEEGVALAHYVEPEATAVSVVWGK